jgi:hypothetical protein
MTLPLLPIGTSVRYASRVREGVGQITKHLPTTRGVWYEITDHATGATVKCRRIQLKVRP